MQLSPESVRFTDEGMIPAGTYYIMRPEAVEALFYMWRLTKDNKWRDHGWKIFEAIAKHCKAEAGFTYVPVQHDSVLTRLCVVVSATQQLKVATLFRTTNSSPSFWLRHWCVTAYCFGFSIAYMA